MAILPEKFTKNVGENEEITYWCRRSTFEVVEEWSQGLFGIYVWTLAILDIYFRTGWSGWLWGLSFNLWLIWYIVKEQLEWFNEVHIITEYEESPSGVYYKTEGAFNIKTVDVPVAKADVRTEEPMNVRIWQWITGESLVKTIISTEASASRVWNHRMPARFAQAIRNARGATANKKKGDTPDAVMSSKELRQLSLSGIVPRPKIRQWITALWDSKVLFND